MSALPSGCLSWEEVPTLLRLAEENLREKNPCLLLLLLFPLLLLLLPRRKGGWKGMEGILIETRRSSRGRE